MASLSSASLSAQELIQLPDSDGGLQVRRTGELPLQLAKRLLSDDGLKTELPKRKKLQIYGQSRHRIIGAEHYLPATNELDCRLAIFGALVSIAGV